VRYSVIVLFCLTCLAHVAAGAALLTANQLAVVVNDEEPNSVAIGAA
jgi:hypothetical protein